MQQSFVLIILHISICIRSQLHLWILAGAESRQRFRQYPSFWSRHSAFCPSLSSVCTVPDRDRTSRSAFAVAGLTFGEIAASFYSLYSIRQSWKQISEKSRSVFLPPAAFRRHLQRLLEHALPLTASRVFLNILQSVEAVSIPVCLQYYGMPAAQSLQTYGVLTGMALPCILFPSASYQCRFFYASADGSRASGNERAAADFRSYHFKNRLFLHICLDVFVVVFLLILREMDWNFSVQKSACRVVLFSRFPGFVRFYTRTRFFLA